MYNIIMYLIEFGVTIGSLFSEKVRMMRRGERLTLRMLREKIKEGDRYVWFHAASLGEFEQGRPLIEEFRRLHPELKILLTFFSPSGYEVRKNYRGADIVCYMPIDTITNARRFLRAVRPVMAFFIKYEFWYNHLHILRHRGVPTYSVSSVFRPGQIFFRWYGRSYAHVLKCFTHFYVQNEESRRLLEKIGIHDVSVVGDTRFDRVLQIKQAARRLPAIEEFVGGDVPVFVAGSSWPPDEDIFIPYFNQQPAWKIVIAPHVISESHLKQIEEKLQMPCLRYTEIAGANASGEPLSEGAKDQLHRVRCLIIDCFGLLSSIYHYGRIAYVGGGFGVGIHNVLEAAVWNMPVVFGPNNQHFQEAQGLKSVGGGFEISGSEDFDHLMQTFSDDPGKISSAGECAGRYVASMTGATAKIMSDVNRVLKS